MNPSIQLTTARKIRAAIMVAATVAFVASSIFSLSIKAGPNGSSSPTELALETGLKAPKGAVKQ